MSFSKSALSKLFRGGQSRKHNSGTKDLNDLQSVQHTLLLQCDGAFAIENSRCGIFLKRAVATYYNSARSRVRHFTVRVSESIRTISGQSDIISRKP